MREWTDEQIENRIQKEYHYLDSDNCESIIESCKEVRNDLQEKITALEIENERLRANADPEALIIVYGKGVADEKERSRKRIIELEETLSFAAKYKGIEARACPLCRYENGKFIEHCQMHKDMAKMQNHIAELEKELSDATVWGQACDDVRAELEAELATAQRWKPLPDGTWFWSEMDKTVLDISNDGKTIAIDDSEHRLTKTFNNVPVRLCRLTEVQGDMPDDLLNAISVCVNYGMPLGITYADYNAARDRVRRWLDKEANNE